jgi:uncharacterized protein
MVTSLARPAHDLNWLITNFVERVAAVAHAIVVSADGLAMAFSKGLPADRVDQLAAVTAGLTSLTQGASRMFEGGMPTQTVVDMQRGLLIVMAISDGSSLAVLAAADCDMGLVAYEMALLVERVGSALTPQVRGAQLPGDLRRMIDCDRRRRCRSRATVTGCPLAMAVIRHWMTLNCRRTTRIFWFGRMR